MDQDPAGIAVTYYTDPLCPWSWAFEPQWRRLRAEFGDRLARRHVMGGMIADWRSFHDPINGVHNPAQMAVQWYEARRMTGMPLDERIWHESPPSSSYPACLAVKAAGRQGPDAADSYLRRLREAVMVDRRDVARGEVLLAIADELADDRPTGLAFDADRFRDDLVAPEVAEAFHEDLREVSYRAIRRFPTLVFRAGDGPEIALVGHRPYAIIRSVLDRLAPGLTPAPAEADAVAYVRRWGRAHAREVAEALGLEDAAALRSLEDAAAAGALGREESAPGWFRQAPPATA
jgi:predicted DsbA family dithiol-disulfide isomerase